LDLRALNLIDQSGVLPSAIGVDMGMTLPRYPPPLLQLVGQLSGLCPAFTIYGHSGSWDYRASCAGTALHFCGTLPQRVPGTVPQFSVDVSHALQLMLGSGDTRGAIRSQECLFRSSRFSSDTFFKVSSMGFAVFSGTTLSMDAVTPYRGRIHAGYADTIASRRTGRNLVEQLSKVMPG